jgi:hypothetical protein
MCYLSKNLQNTSRFVTLFLAHGDIVVGFAIFHIVYSKKKKKEKWKGKKKRKKGTPPWYVNVCGHLMDSVSHSLRKEKKGGRSAKLYKRAQKCQSLSKTCFIFVWKIVRTLLPVVDKDNHLSKSNFYLSILQMKSCSTCLITASLYEGPLFYFYVESPPSTFMHHLREYSCHS